MMTQLSVKERIHEAMIECEGLTYSPHRFGGTEYKLDKREIGHIHGNKLVDIPFPMKIRDEVIKSGEAEVHHILPQSGWVSVFIRTEDDVQKAIRLLKKSYKLAIEQKQKRNHS